MPLAKWQCNKPGFCDKIGVASSPESSRAIEDVGTKILGISWLPGADTFKFTTLPYTEGSEITKRVILSGIAQLYDPLGFLAPVTIRAKVLLQQLWLDKLSWDDAVSTAVAEAWVAFRRELTHLGTISVPRWIGMSTGSSVQIHGFSDASLVALAAVVFIRVTGPGGDTRVSMVCAKTKVAPLKRLVIARLELAAALVLAKLTRYVQTVLDLGSAPVYLWTDSSVTLTWVMSHPSRWKDFVRNRITAIQELLPTGQWRYTPGRDNPADCASRGLTITQHEQFQPWRNGPHWLAKSSVHWPLHYTGTADTAALEERPGLILTTSTKPSRVYELIHRYSSLTRLLRITALLFKAIAKMRGASHGSTGAYISPVDLDHARIYWVKATQAEYFDSELKILTGSHGLGRAHPITRLTGYIDNNGTLRVGGRLKHSDLQPECIHAAILPRDSPLTQLIITDAHVRTFHGGTQVTLAYIRKCYWIIGGWAPVRLRVLKCVRCARFRAVKAQQLMGQLPVARVTPSRAFLFTGVDYAGPESLKIGRGRGSRVQKDWQCIFVCFAISALHLEIVTDLSSDTFLAAYRRFIGRRGVCHTLYSDCGTNFRGASAELTKLFKAGTRESKQLALLLANDGTTWAFNPPGAPHMGGKWEAAVKSVKFHLRRTIGETSLTFEEFTTLLVQVEAVLNSRPLEPMSEDPEDLTVLTPGHFLTGDALTAVPEPSYRDINPGRLSRWQFIQSRLQHFWDHWSASYLQRQ